MFVGYVSFCQRFAHLLTGNQSISRSFLSAKKCEGEQQNKLSSPVKNTKRFENLNDLNIWAGNVIFVVFLKRERNAVPKVVNETPRDRLTFALP